MTNAWLAVDTGGSKTHLLLSDERGSLLGESFAVGAGLATDWEDEPLDALERAVARLTAGTLVTRAVANLGGKNENQLRRALERCLPRARIRVFRESSGVLADALRARHGADAIALYGTGSIIVSRGANGLFIADGWGRDIGDAGSGYWIGLEAIRRSLTALEGDAPLSPLAREITGLSEPLRVSEQGSALMRLRDEVRESVGLPLDRARVAALTRSASAHAESGDASARLLFSDAGRELAQGVLRALRKADVGQGARVLVIGGMTNVATLWGDAFDSALRAERPDASWRTSACDLTEGAMEYAKNMDVGSISK